MTRVHDVDTDSGEPRELLCMICDRDYPVWYAPDDLWNPVMRSPDGSEALPFVCPTCFTLEAVKAGIDIVFKLSSRHEHPPDGHTLTHQFELPARSLDARAAWWGAQAVGETPGRRDHALLIAKGYREAAAELRIASTEVAHPTSTGAVR